MPSIKKIVAGLALDGHDDRTVARAIQLSVAHAARLVLVHAIENFVDGDSTTDGEPDMDAVRAMLERDATDRLDAAIAGANLGIRHQEIIAKGKPFETILSLAQERKADLVVIGPGRAKTLRQKVLGSTADRIVRSASVPVLVARSERPERYRRVVVAADHSPQSLSASRAARSLAPDAVIEHIHALEMPLSFEQALLRAGTSAAEIKAFRRARLAGARERLIAAFGENGSSLLKLRILRGNAQDIFVRHSRSRRTDLIALGTHGRGTVAQVLLGSVAQKVLQEAACDVLVVSR